MATITITITEAPLQLLAGIPASISLDTNTPATIFYTLNGDTPTVNSSVYVGAFEMPTNTARVVLKAFATNGTDTSPVITQEWKTNIVPARQPYDTATIRDSVGKKATYPFGSSAQASGEPPIFGNTGGVIVDNNMVPREPSGVDKDGNPVGFFTPPKDQYDFKFSETNSIGEMGLGVGTLPGGVTSIKPRNDNDHPESTNTESPFFNPKAMVIFQDSSEEPYDADIPKINRPFFDFENPAKARDGTLLTSTDAITPSGGFLKAHYNARDNTLNYYYYDNRVARWVISKEPYVPSSNPTTNLSGFVSRSSRGEGAGRVFKWIPFQYRRLI